MISQPPALPGSSFTPVTFTLRPVNGWLSGAHIRDDPYRYWNAWRPLRGAGGGSAFLVTGAGSSEQPTRRIAATAARNMRIHFQCSARYNVLRPRGPTYFTAFYFTTLTVTVLEYAETFIALKACTRYRYVPRLAMLVNVLLLAPTVPARAKFVVPEGARSM